MARLFTYTIPFDDGAAPNPFNGMCSLAICKPAIRRAAQPGDWVAGFGSKYAPSGDMSGRLVYAMRVQEVMTLEAYDRAAPSRWPHRIPDIESPALQDRLGDCIYDFSTGTPVQRPGVHDAGNKATDLAGDNVLISRDFYYFGSRAIRLPDNLRAILHQTQGHKSTCNAPYLDPFVRWLRTAAPDGGQIYGWPDSVVDWDRRPAVAGAQCALMTMPMTGNARSNNEHCRRPVLERLKLLALVSRRREAGGSRAILHGCSKNRRRAK
jgi:hypothetical protein